MKNILLFLFSSFGILCFSQTSYTIYDQIVFYDGYASTVTEPVPPGIVRINNARYTTKLSDEMVNNLSEGSLSLDVTIGALCDNYDRLGEIFLAMVPQGATEYDSDEVDRIEIARIITPFMNKNINPTEVPYHFNLDNVAEIFKDAALNAEFDFWLEFEVFGVPYAAQTQVAGCAGRIDVFEGTLVFNVDEPTETYTDAHFLLPLSDYEVLNNYNSTDVPGETTKIINFTLDEAQENVVLYLISSNHGANSGGEEYERRKHYLYLDDELIQVYTPGGKSCEPWRQYNTQGNGIYGQNPKTTRQWLTFNNWCPGDKIPNREFVLGNLSAGNHTIKLDVPDAVFVGGEGYFPISMYLQNRNSGQLLCPEPSDFVITDQHENTISIDWTEMGDASEWEILYGRRSVPANENFVSDTDGETGYQITGLDYNYFYEIYLRSTCSDELSSPWIGPIESERVLSLDENNLAQIQIYPNPVQDILHIETQTEIAEVSIFSADGKKVVSETASTLNLSSLPAGNYVVMVKLKNGKNISKKIMKH